jgi:hypothetical protein
MRCKNNFKFEHLDEFELIFETAIGYVSHPK